MKLLTSKLEEPTRSAVRFVLLGLVGTGIQYGIYYGLLEVIDRLHMDTPLLVSAAFSIGFVLEMIFNYFMSNYYTFGTKPDWKNAGGFVAARGINYVLQILCLNLLLYFSIGEELAGLLAIFLAGIVNYFIMRFFFKRKNTNNQIS